MIQQILGYDADLRVSKLTRLTCYQRLFSVYLTKENGTVVLQIMHRGIAGGWTIDTVEKFQPQVICGLFMFCRYIEQENEFIIV